MQETRRHILDILKLRGQATVDDIVEQLTARSGKQITAVTVRHHLSVLQNEGYITEPELRHRTTPGRPQNVYTLTEKAHGVFPNNYPALLVTLLEQLQQQLPTPGVNVILEGVADQMAAHMNLEGLADLATEQRLSLVVGYLNSQGYDADWEAKDDGYILHTRNCPYHHVAHESDSLCAMDLRLIATLVGSVPRRLARVSQGDESCAYLIPHSVVNAAG
jgi:predicted ArsR family transcriptional regulator